MDGATNPPGSTDGPTGRSSSMKRWTLAGRTWDELTEAAASDDLSLDDGMGELTADDSEARARWDDRLGSYVDLQGPLDVLRLRPQTEPPWPTSDNPMLGYLVDRGAEIAGEEGLGAALAWLASNAWFEGAVAERLALRAVLRRRLTPRTRTLGRGRRGLARSSNPAATPQSTPTCREDGPSSLRTAGGVGSARGHTWCQRLWCSRGAVRRGVADEAGTRISAGARCQCRIGFGDSAGRGRRCDGCRRRFGHGRRGCRRGRRGRGFRCAQRRRSGDDLHGACGSVRLGRDDRRRRQASRRARGGDDGRDASAMRLPQPARCSPQPPTGWASGARRASACCDRCGGTARRGRGSASRCLPRTTRCRRR